MDDLLVSKDSEDFFDQVVGLRRLARSAKGAASALGAIADGVRDVAVELTAARAAIGLGDDAPPCSWEVERHKFLCRLVRRRPLT